MAKKFNPEFIYRYKWQKWFVYLMLFTPLLMGLFIVKPLGISNGFFAFLSLMSACLGIMIFLKASNRAVINAHKTGQIDDKTYDNYYSRTLFGYRIPQFILGFGAVFFVALLVDTKVNVIIKAVPSPELIAEMKHFLRDDDLKHSEVTFDGSEQEIVFYTDKNDMPNNIQELSTYNKGFPQYFLHGKNLAIDYSTPPLDLKVVDINNKAYCTLILKTLHSVGESIVEIDNNTGFQIYGSNFNLYVTLQPYFYAENNRCEGSDEYKINDLFELSNRKEAIFYYPHLAQNSTYQEESRISISNWEYLNKKFQGLLVE